MRTELLSATTRKLLSYLHYIGFSNIEHHSSLSRWLTSSMVRIVLGITNMAKPIGFCTFFLFVLVKAWPHIMASKPNSSFQIDLNRGKEIKKGRRFDLPTTVKKNE